MLFALVVVISFAVRSSRNECDVGRVSGLGGGVYRGDGYSAMTMSKYYSILLGKGH